MRRYQEEARRGVFLDQLRSILESEVSWGIGRARRMARRDRLEHSMAARTPQAPGPLRAWSRRLGVGRSLRRLRSLLPRRPARKA